MSDYDATVLRFPATTERCRECGSRATRMCATDQGLTYGCDECSPHWTRITPPEPTEVWECGPHTNAWNGHDARCRRVLPPTVGRAQDGDA